MPLLLMLHDCAAIVLLIGLITFVGVGASEVLVLATMFLVTMIGIEVGFHRHFSHRAFLAKPVVRGVLGAAGAMGLQGNIVTWVTVHRRHHRFADRPGDPHSPNLSGRGLRGLIKGIWHVHAGAQFAPEINELSFLDLVRYSRDLLRDPLVLWLDRHYLAWVLLGVAIPAALGWTLTGTIRGSILGALWGGPIRILLTHHVTWTVNSAGHLVGSRPHCMSDSSTNLWWLALPTLGGSWHNNHHALPSSARAGLTWRQVDLAYLTICSLAKLGLASGVRTPEAQTPEG